MGSVVKFAEAASASDPAEYYRVLLPIGLILIIGKAMAMLMRRINVPEVVGYLLGGLLVGLIFFIPNQPILTPFTLGGISDLAKIGVVLLLFTAGLGTNLRQIKAEGVASVVITTLGVLFPMCFGFLVAFLCRVFGGMDPEFYQGLVDAGVNPIYSDIFYGVVLTATSVSLTVAVLQEIGQLNSKVGNALVAASIIDDVIGIILLSIVLSISGAGNSSSYSWVIPTGDGPLSVLWLILEMLAFFGIAIGLGVLIHKLFNRWGRKYPHHRRLPMLAFGFCFVMSFVAECFHIADITGAYIAGLILSSTSASSYIDERAQSTANVIFTPIFFASVALKMYTSFGFDHIYDGTRSNASFTPMFIVFGFCWILAGMLGKVLGAGLGARLSRFSMKDSLRVGVGMMARAEVIIVTAQEGVDAGLVESGLIPFTLGAIILSSFVTPIALRALYKGETKNWGGEVPKAAMASQPLRSLSREHDKEPQK